jgi:hypothetical protein
MNNCLLIIKRIRFHFLWNLVFSFLLIACTETKKENNGITIQWNGEKAEAVAIPLGLLPGIRQDSVVEQVKVRLVNNAVAIIPDDLRSSNGSIIFKPLIAFTPGLKYEVLFSNKKIGEFEIPQLSIADLTEVVAVYPTADTLPENALKLYIVFSKPMQEGQALQHISFIKNDRDTLTTIFLDLTQELWNRERTILTLWFDPGRIKRELQPNQSLGKPLQQNNRYNLTIDKDWRDERGLTLGAAYEKIFIAGKSDSASPDPDNWVINQPKASTREALTIDLHESLDYLLLKNAIRITDYNGKIIKGSFEPMLKETILSFTPTEAWRPADYLVKIEARLEDLAGNNLNRLFDTDITRSGKSEKQTAFTRKFRVN